MTNEKILLMKQNRLRRKKPIQDIYESSIEVNCGNRYFEYLVFSKPNNDYLFKIFNENDIETIDTIVGNHLLNSISFNVQPKLVVRKLKTKPKHLSPPYLGYIEFSDIFKGLNGKYYFHILFCEKLLCDDKEDRRWASSIIFEIERCSSGLLTFSRMYGGLGDGKFIDCPDTYNCR
jgi:hypothetical protein